MDGAVLVTGANAGIGAEIARRLARDGTRLAIHYLDAAAAKPRDLHQVPGRAAAHSLLEELRALGAGEAIALEADLAEPEHVAALVERSCTALGPLTGLVNNAAHCGAQDSVADARWEDAIRHFAVNAAAPLLLTSEFAEQLGASGGCAGSIVNVSTDCARAFPTQVAYGASKAALESLTRSAAVELGPLGIRVNAIAPGPVQTGWMSEELIEAVLPHIPLGRVGTPAGVAAVAAFLLGPDSGWVTGQIVKVDGGHVL